MSHLLNITTITVIKMMTAAPPDTLTIITTVEPSVVTSGVGLKARKYSRIIQPFLQTFMEGTV